MKDISTSIARLLLKNAEKDDLESIDQWKKESNEKTSFLHAFETYWNNPVNEQSTLTISNARERLLARMNESKIQSPVNKPKFYLLRRIAAILVFTISIASLSIYFASQSSLFYQNSWVEINTEAGQQSKVNLPDGTLVWLNSQTTLKYHPNKKVRKVELSGEAYFEVSHAADYPFVVVSGNTEVKVLGTKFNVTAYSELQTIEASLIEGKISFSVPEFEKTVEVKPGERIVYSLTEQSLKRTSERVEDDALWRQGIISFKNETFNRLIFKLEKHYNVTFLYDEISFKEMHYTGNIDNLSINNVLDFITLTIPMKYEIKNNSITLKLDKQ